MGSGKGKSRRTSGSRPKHAPPAVPANLKRFAYGGLATEGSATFYKEKWEKFVRDNQLTTLGVRQYYLGQPVSAKAPLDAAECEKLLQGLFDDAVTVGAIALPDGYLADDFEVKVIAGATHAPARGTGSLRGNIAAVILKDPIMNRSGDFEYLSEELDANLRLLSPRIVESIFQFCQGLDKFFLPEK